MVFIGASKGRTSKPQTTRSAAQRGVQNRDVVVAPYRNANAREGNRGFAGGGSRPEGSRR